MLGCIGVADLEGRILKWPKSDEKLCSVGTEGVDLPRQGRKWRQFEAEIVNFRCLGRAVWEIRPRWPWVVFAARADICVVLC